jgi:hypothetical protein
MNWKKKYLGQKESHIAIIWIDGQILGLQITKKKKNGIPKKTTSGITSLCVFSFG